MSGLAIHLGVGIVWGAIVLAFSWREGRMHALRAPAITTLIATAISAGCNAIRPATDIECIPAGPSIYNDC